MINYAFKFHTVGTEVNYSSSTVVLSKGERWETCGSIWTQLDYFRPRYHLRDLTNYWGIIKVGSKAPFLYQFHLFPTYFIDQVRLHLIFQKISSYSNLFPFTTGTLLLWSTNIHKNNFIKRYSISCLLWKMKIDCLTNRKYDKTLKRGKLLQRHHIWDRGMFCVSYRIIIKLKWLFSTV